MDENEGRCRPVGRGRRTRRKREKSYSGARVQGSSRGFSVNSDLRPLKLRKMEREGEREGEREEPILCRELCQELCRPLYSQPE